MPCGASVSLRLPSPLVLPGTRSNAAATDLPGPPGMKRALALVQNDWLAGQPCDAADLARPIFLAARLRAFLATFSCDSMALRSRRRLLRSSSTVLIVLWCRFGLSRNCFSVRAASSRASWARSSDLPAAVADALADPLALPEAARLRAGGAAPRAGREPLPPLRVRSGGGRMTSRSDTGSWTPETIGWYLSFCAHGGTRRRYHQRSTWQPRDLRVKPGHRRRRHPLRRQGRHALTPARPMEALGVARHGGLRQLSRRHSHSHADPVDVGAQSDQFGATAQHVVRPRIAEPNGGYRVASGAQRKPQRVTADGGLSRRIDSPRLRSVPGCTRDRDRSPVLGAVAWNHRPGPGWREAAGQAAGTGADLEDAVGVPVSHRGRPGAKRPVGRAGRAYADRPGRGRPGSCCVRPGRPCAGMPLRAGLGRCLRGSRTGGGGRWRCARAGLVPGGRARHRSGRR